MTIYTVNNNSSDISTPYSFAWCVNAANSDSGSTINFSVNGVIDIISTITISAPMTITGPGKSLLTFTDNVDSSSGNEYCFSIGSTVSTVSMSGFTIEYDQTPALNSIIYSSGEASLTISDCSFNNFSSSLISSPYVIYYSIIYDTNQLNISGTDFISNSLRLLYSNIRPQFSNCNFTNNTVTNSTYNNIDAGCNFINCNIVGTSVSSNFINSSPNFTSTLSYCTIYNNTNSIIVTSNQNFTMNDCNIYNNSVLNNIFYLANNSNISQNTITITNCTIDNNTSVNDLMVIEPLVNQFTTFNMSYTTIDGNTSSSGSNIIWFNLPDGSGTKATFNNLQMSNNTTKNFTGIHISNQTTVSTYESNLNIYNTTLNNNISSDGSSLTGAINFSSIIESTPLINLINCTIANNTSNGIYLNYAAQAIIIGCTISGNGLLSPNLYGIYSLGEINAIGNTVVAYNNNDSTTPDISGGAISSRGYNFIGNATGVTTSFNQAGDQYGIDGAPINPYLLPITNNGGNTLTMMTQTVPFNSPLINAGGNAIVTAFYNINNPEVLNNGQPIDQRGYSRIILGTVDIGAVENSSTICFSGETMIYVKNRITDKIGMIPVAKIFSGIHQVYDVELDDFVDIIYNAITGTTTRFIKIPKDFISKNIPDRDTFMTPGHKIIFNGIETKVKDVKGTSLIKLPVQKIYTICTENKIVFRGNNMDICSWDSVEFVTSMQNKNMIWKDNLEEYLEVRSNYMV